MTEFDIAQIALEVFKHSQPNRGYSEAVEIVKMAHNLVCMKCLSPHHDTERCCVRVVNINSTKKN